MSRFAIVTGVSTGLGEALAARLLARGFDVLGVGRRRSPCVAEAGFTFVQADLARVDALDSTLREAFAAIASQKPAFVCLVNNAATVGSVGLIGTLGGAAIGAELAVNLVAPAIVADCFCRAFAGLDCERRIVNVSSGAAQSPIAGASIYSIAKAGLEMLTRSLAAEHREPGYCAITLRPGIIDTPMQEAIRGQSAGRLPGVAMFRDLHASGKLVPAADVAAKVVARLVEGEIDNGRTYSYAEL